MSIGYMIRENIKRNQKRVFFGLVLILMAIVWNIFYPFYAPVDKYVESRVDTIVAPEESPRGDISYSAAYDTNYLIVTEY